MTRNTFLAAVFLLALTRSAAALDFDVNDMPHPLEHARAGQWLTLRIADGRAEQTQTVTSVTGEGEDRVFGIRTVITVDGKEAESHEEEISYRDVRAIQEATFGGVDNATLTPIRIKVKDREYDGFLLSFVTRDVGIKIDLSESIPILGYANIRAEGEDGVDMELVDFGG